MGEISPITITVDVPPAITERGIPVPESNWSLLESRIGSIEEINILFSVGAGAFAGIVITSIAAAFSLPPNHLNFWPFIIVGIAGLVCTALCCIFASRLNKCISAKKKYILEDLRVLKRKYIRDQNEP